MDAEELQEGEEIRPALLTAIEQRRIFIPVFSKDFATSKWCLQELAKIHECYKLNDQIVLPIFFDVNPSEVRNQIGIFGKGFQKNKQENNLEPEIEEKWSGALREIGKLKGWNLKEVENGNESKLIQLIVERALSVLDNTTPLVDAKYPIGLDSHVEYLWNLLTTQSADSQFVGICGMGGIGKRTMAKAIYNRMSKTHKFDGRSFLADVREQASKHTPVFLQEKLLSNILGKQKHAICHVDIGINLIKKKLQGKKVLLVLDDVNDRKQLNALASELSWFGPGNKIIITTRDEEVLNSVQVNSNNIYWPEGLDANQSLQLFSMHAFRMDQLPEEYNQLSQKMVSYADGLPLTLEVLGSSLCNKEKEEWDSAIQKLKEVPPKEVLNKLRISFDGLDDKEQSIFLDTACFLIGMDKELAHYIWEGCGFHSKVGLRALIRKSLMKIGDDNKLRMHDQLRDMGRRIVYEENLKKPGKRSRLWSHEAMMVVQAHKGTQEVEGILLDFMCKGSETGDRILIEDLAMMPNLRLLQVNGVNLEGKIEKLPSNLRWLCWQGCILKILPSDFCLDQLLVLDLSNNKIQKAWDSELQNKPFKNLKVLNLSSSSYLEKFPIFTRFPLLEKLILKGCKALTDIHESIGKLEKLNLLDLNGCIKLKKLPDSIGDLKSLVELELDGTQIHELPYSIGMLSTMRRLLLRDCKSLARIYNSIGRLKSLLVLDLSSTLITELPADIELLEKLERLCVKCCRYLQSLPKLPSSLIFLDASGCVSLKRLPNLSNLRNLKLIQLAHCSKLVEIQGLEGVESLEDLDVNGCINLSYTPLEVLVQDSINNQPFSSSDIQQRYEIGNDAISNGMILCLVSELVEEERETEDKGNLLSCTLLIKARIRRNRKQITCTSSLVIEGIQMTTQNIKCIYHFEEPNWFGFPLKGKDEIEIVEIQWSGCTPQAKVLYSKLSSKDREHIQQSVSQLSSRMVKDSFNMSYDDDGRLQSLRVKVEANAEMIDMSYVDDGKLYPRPRERESENQQQDNKRRC